MNPVDSEYLSPTSMIDSDNERIIEYAMKIVEDTEDDPVLKAVELYYAVRDDIWYDPYHPFYLPEHHRASHTLRGKRGYCVPKASLLCAVSRVCGIPSRLGFATVRNHLTTRQMIDFMGSDLFVFHGFTELYLEGKWVRATPAFNIELCKRHQVEPLEFNGREDSLFQPYNIDKKQFMEYLEYHGSYADIPIEDIITEYNRVYGEDRVRYWIQELEKAGDKPLRDFYREQVIN